VHLHDVEEKVHIERTMTMEAEVAEETIRWVPNVGNN
jgi:hypothetical protein